jgi:CheY-like chemotaxis protein
VTKILVVDDANADRALASGLLTRSIDCTIVEAVDGNDALSKVQQQQPDLVLTDLEMPGLNGLELVAAIKEDYPLIPVILMTGKGSEEIAARALKEGAASYVPKRKLADDLCGTVKHVLNASRENQVLSQLMHYLTDCECVFVLQNDLTLIRSLVSYLMQMIRCLPLGDETERLRVGIALEAALSNAYYHGNLELGSTNNAEDRRKFDELARERYFEKPYRERKIRIRTKISRDEAVFIVRDDGPGFDAEAYLPTDDNMADQTTGRGLRLMFAVMDEVSFNEAGNEVTLLKRRVCEEVDESTED